MAEKLQKGWLKTREGNKFAPATLIENVYDRTGVDYDTAIKKYIADNFGNTNQALDGISKDIDKLEGDVTSLQAQDQALAARLANFDGTDSDILYIVDGQNRAIAKIDADGVTSIDFNIPGETSLSQVSQELENLKTVVGDLGENIDVSDSDILYIIDGKNQVIAKIDYEGVHSVNFLTNDTDFNSIVNRVDIAEDDIDKIEDRLTNFDGSDSNVLYIIDGNNQVIAKVDEAGVHSTNIHAKENVFSSKGNLNDTIDVVATHNQTLNDITPQIPQIATNKEDIQKLEERLENFNGEDSNILYIVDNQNRVIARIDENGVSSTEFSIYNSDSQLLHTLSEKAKQSDLNTANENIATLLTWIGKEENAAAIWTAVNANTKAIQDINNDSTYDSFGDVAQKFISIDEELAKKALQSDLNNLSGKVDSNTQAISTKAEQTTVDAIDGRLITVEGDVEKHDANLEAINKVVNTEDSDTLYVIDNSNNVIAKVNDQGVISIDMIATNAAGSYTVSLVDTEARVSDLEQVAEDQDKDLEKLNSTVSTLKTIVNWTGESAPEGVNARISAAEGRAAADAQAKADAAKSALLGGASADYDTLKKAEDKIKGNATAIEQLSKDIDNVSNIMNFVGVSSTDPSSIYDSEGVLMTVGTVTINGVVITPKTGDVTIYNEIEYVYSDGEWHEFGDASGNAAAITALDGRVNTLEEWKTDTVDPALSDHEKRLDDVEPIVESHTASITELNRIVNYASPDGTTATVNARIEAAKTAAAADATGKANTAEANAKQYINEKLGTEEITGTVNKNIQDLNNSVDGLITKTNNLDASNGSDTFYVIDAQERVVAKFDRFGLSTIDVALPNNNLTMLNNGIFFDEYDEVDINF